MEEPAQTFELLSWPGLALFIAAMVAIALLAFVIEWSDRRRRRRLELDRNRQWVRQHGHRSFRR